MNKYFSLIIIFIISTPLFSSSYQTMKARDGQTIEYFVMLPKKINRLMLAIPPGPGNKAFLEKGLVKWLPQLKKAGVLVVSPVAPGKLFFQGAETYIPELLAHVRRRFKIANKKFALFGISNGGIGAIRVATLYPEHFLSLTVAPGFAKPEDMARLSKLKPLAVNIFVGSNDGAWVKKAKKTTKSLKSMKVRSKLTIVKGQGHGVAESIHFKKLMNVLFSNYN